MILALMNSSLAFFLASFQVHEKSILLVLIPASFLFYDDIAIISWMQILGTFSMFPLLIRDGQRIPYIIITIFFIVVSFMLQSTKNSSSSSSLSSSLLRKFSISSSLLLSIKSTIILISLIGMILLHLMEIFIIAPKRFV
jgi:alpha-1,3-glucosyltransferase